VPDSRQGILAYVLWRAKAVKAWVLGWMGAAYATGAAVRFHQRNRDAAAPFLCFCTCPLMLLLMHAAGRSAAGWNAVVTYVIVSAVLTMSRS